MLYLFKTIKSRFIKMVQSNNITGSVFSLKRNRSRGKDILSDPKFFYQSFSPLASINMPWTITKQKCDMVRFKKSSNTRWSPLLRVAGGAIVFNHSLVTGGRSTYKARTTDLYTICIFTKTVEHFFLVSFSV